jgi:hypothetical protein
MWQTRHLFTSRRAHARELTVGNFLARPIPALALPQRDGIDYSNMTRNQNHSRRGGHVFQEKADGHD